MARVEAAKGNTLKSYGDPTTIGSANCPVCLVQGVVVLPDKTTHYSYNDPASFDFEPVMFERIRHLGFCPMHRRIRAVENLCKLCEQKYAALNYPLLYYHLDTEKKAKAIKAANKVFKGKFKDQLGVKYFVPDPQNGGNSNTGPQISRILANYQISAAILEISSDILYYIGKCCDFINDTSFVSPEDFDNFAKNAFAAINFELGEYGSISATTHSLLCHGSLYIRYAQNDLGVALGALTEGSIEAGNKENLRYRRMYARKSAIKKETKDIFKRRGIMSCPHLIIEGVGKQKIRKGNIRKKKSK